jgi:hypothetical protein
VSCYCTLMSTRIGERSPNGRFVTRTFRCDLNKLLLATLGTVLPLKTTPRFRANGAKDVSSGQPPGVTWPRITARPEWAGGIPAPFQGVPQSTDSDTQGVALG